MMLNDFTALKLHETRIKEVEHAREQSTLIKFAQEAKEQLKLFEPLRKLRR